MRYCQELDLAVSPNPFADPIASPRMELGGGNSEVIRFGGDREGGVLLEKGKRHQGAPPPHPRVPPQGRPRERLRARKKALAKT